MKKSVLFLFSAFLLAFAVQAQKVEVLYFKADLPCCPGRACDQVESLIKEIVESNYGDKGVVFKQVKISDEVNKSLVEKHKARSQTVVVVSGNRASDASQIITAYSRTRNRANLEKDLKALIDEFIK